MSPSRPDHDVARRSSGSDRWTEPVGGSHRRRRDEVFAAMTVSLRAGEVMLESAVATSDVEHAVRRMAAAFGLVCEVTVTLNVITLGYLGPEVDEPVTMIRVVDFGEPRLDRLVEIETLIRDVEGGRVGIVDAYRALDHIETSPSRYSRPLTFGAGLVAAAAWIVFAGGGPVAVAAGVAAALIVQPLVTVVSRSRVPLVFASFVAALVVAGVPHLVLWAGAPIAMTPAIAGGLYPLLPGGALVASVVDGLSGAPLSSLAKGLQAAVVAAALALGVLTVLSIADALGVTGTVDLRAVPAVAVAVAAAVATVGLAIQRGMPISAIAPTAAIAVVAWTIPWAAPTRGVERTLAVFGAAAVIGFGGQVAARIQRLPGSIYTSCAVYVLVPGIAIYLSMLAFAGGNEDLGTELGFQALRTAGAIAAGIALGAALGATPAPVRRPLALWRPRR